MPWDFEGLQNELAAPSDFLFEIFSYSYNIATTLIHIKTVVTNTMGFKLLLLYPVSPVPGRDEEAGAPESPNPSPKP